MRHLVCTCILSDVCKTTFGNSKDEPALRGTFVKTENDVVAEASYFFKVTCIDVVVVFDIVPAIIKDLLVAVKMSVRLLFAIATVASLKLFAICSPYDPKATAKGILFGSDSVTLTPLGKVIAFVEVLIEKISKSSVPSNTLIA
jgi:hypothetical protein